MENTGIGIHGFGRVGRVVMRTALQNKLFTPVLVSDIKDLPTLAALFAVDSNYGVWPEEVKDQDGVLSVGGKVIKFVDTKQSLPDWGKLGVKIVIDCSGRATTRAMAQLHIDNGAEKVLVSAPSKTKEDCDKFLLLGINFDSYDSARDHIISMASCTTNALAPLVKVINENFGIKSGLFTTVHAYTNTQSLTDQPLKDRRDSWAAAQNIIPSSSGAAKALGFIWPELANKIQGKAYRVPVPTGSIVELNVLLGCITTEEEVKEIFKEASQSGPLQGIMGVLEEEFASCRIVGEPLSSLVDLPLTKVVEGRMLSMAAWYDNEWGYATRLAELACLIDT